MMKRAVLIWATLALAFGGIGQARADFIYNIDQDFFLSPNGGIGSLVTGTLITSTDQGTVSGQQGGSFTLWGLPSGVPNGSGGEDPTTVVSNPIFGNFYNAQIIATPTSLQFEVFPATSGKVRYGEASITDPSTGSAGIIFQYYDTELSISQDNYGGSSISYYASTFDQPTELNGNLYYTFAGITPVPEPSGFALLGMATIMFAGCYAWWRRKLVTA